MSRNVIQLTLLMAIAVAAVIAAFTVAGNLADLGITFEFGFLSEPAKFDVDWKLIDYEPTDSYFRVLMVGLANTIFIAIASLVLATVLGAVIGWGQASQCQPISTISIFYTELVTNIPVLVHIMCWYFILISYLPSTSKSINALDTIYLNNRGMYFPLPFIDIQNWLMPTALLVIFIGLLVIVALLRSRNRDHSEIRTWRAPGIKVAVAGAMIAFSAFVNSIVSLEHPVWQTFYYSGGGSVTLAIFSFIIALSTYSAGHIATIMRDGMIESGGARLPRWRDVANPAVIRQYFQIFRYTSLGFAIGVSDLLGISFFIMTQTLLIAELLIIVAVIYFVFHLLGLWIERLCRTESSHEAPDPNKTTNEGLLSMPNRGGPTAENLVSIASILFLIPFTIYFVFAVVFPFIAWATVDADFSGISVSDCTGKGACWVVLTMNTASLFTGLLASFLMTVITVMVATPLGVALAIGGRSKNQSVAYLCRGIKELFSGLPLLVLMFMTLHMRILPTIPTVNDQQANFVLAFILFATAMIARIIDRRLTLEYGHEWQSGRKKNKEIREQCLRYAMPDMLDVSKVIFMSTTLLTIMGGVELFDTIVETIMQPQRQRFLLEGLLVAIAVYWPVCFGLGKLSEHLRRRVHSRHEAAKISA